MNFYIVRHGETKESKSYKEYNVQSIRNAPILDESKTTIVRIASFLKNVETDYNVSSPYFRCRQTVKIIEDITGKAFVFDERIGEYLLAVNEETHQELVSRLKDFLQDIKDSKFKNVMICTHGGVIAALKHLIIEGEFKHEQLRDYPESSIITVIKDHRIEELNFE